MKLYRKFYDGDNTYLIPRDDCEYVFRAIEEFESSIGDLHEFQGHLHDLLCNYKRLEGQKYWIMLDKDVTE